MVVSSKSPNICLDLVLKKTFFRGYQSLYVTMLSATAQLAMQMLPKCFLLASLFEVLAMSSVQVPTDMSADSIFFQVRLETLKFTASFLFPLYMYIGHVHWLGSCVYFSLGRTNAFC